jgi:hypothetical protein
MQIMAVASLIIAIPVFVWGIVCLCLPKQETRKFGVELITVSALIFSIIYSVRNYELTNQEFNLRNRPFIRARPVYYEGGDLYQVTQTWPGAFRLNFQLNIYNVGSVPATDIKINKQIEISGLPASEFQTGVDNPQVVFPGDSIPVTSYFGMSSKKTLSEVKEDIEVREIRLRYLIEYRGVKNYSTCYHIKYPTIKSEVLISSNIDKPCT